MVKPAICKLHYSIKCSQFSMSPRMERKSSPVQFIFTILLAEVKLITWRYGETVRTLALACASISQRANLMTETETCHPNLVIWFQANELKIYVRHNLGKSNYLLLWHHLLNEHNEILFSTFITGI